MKKLFTFTKTLLVAVGLFVGMSAWAVDVPTYNPVTGFYELNSVNYFKKTFDFTTLVYGTTATAAAPTGFSGEGKSSHRYQTAFSKSTTNSEMPLGLTFRNASSEKTARYVVLSNYGLQINGTDMWLYVAGIGDGSIAVLNYYVGDAESTTKISDKTPQSTAITGDGRSNYFELITRDSYYLYTSVDVYFKATTIGDFTPHADGFYYKADGTKYERTTYDFTSIMRYGSYNSNTVAGFNDTGNRYQTEFKETQKTDMPTGLTFAATGTDKRYIYYCDLLGMQSNDNGVELYPTTRNANTTAYLYYKTGTAGKVNFADVSEENISASGESLSFTLANKNSEYVLYTHMEVFDLVGGTVSTALGTNGYATFASPYPLDLTTANLPTGLTAYKASVSGSTVTFTALNQTVPANTGILLQGEPSETYNIPVVASGTDVTENAFLVNTAGTTFANDDDYYFFGLKKNTLTFGTFDPSTVAIPANKAYLRVLKSSITGGARLNISFGDDETTGVSDEFRMKSEPFATTQYFDLQGRRVAQPTKGLYIVNGKKVIVK